MRYLVSCTCLRFLDDEEQEVFEVETSEASEEEARRAVEPEIAEYAGTLGCPTFIRVEGRPSGVSWRR